jgi:hypothetical protein
MRRASVFKSVCQQLWRLQLVECVENICVWRGWNWGFLAQPHPPTHALALTHSASQSHSLATQACSRVDSHTDWLSCFCLGDDEENEDGTVEPKMPTCGDYIMHFLTLFWKLLFAFVPPTGILYCRAPTSISNLFSADRGLARRRRRRRSALSHLAAARAPLSFMPFFPATFIFSCSCGFIWFERFSKEEAYSVLNAILLDADSY